IFIFTVGAAMTDTLDLAQVVERTLATAIAALAAWLICVASEALRRPPTPDLPFPQDPERSLGELGFMAARAAIAALVVVFASHGLGGDGSRRRHAGQPPPHQHAPCPATHGRHDGGRVVGMAAARP